MLRIMLYTIIGPACLLTWAMVMATVFRFPPVVDMTKAWPLVCQQSNSPTVSILSLYQVWSGQHYLFLLSQLWSCQQNLICVYCLSGMAIPAVCVLSLNHVLSWQQYLLCVFMKSKNNCHSICHFSIISRHIIYLRKYICFPDGMS